MPRKARHFVPNAIFHAGARGVDRQPIFLTDHDRRLFRDAMATRLLEVGARTASYCLMPNHFHWEIVTGDIPFDTVFHDALLQHAVRFNRLYGRTGHLFEARHWSFHCSDAQHVVDVAAYIHLNPDRAGLVKAPAEWPWSSFTEWDSSRSGIVDFARVAEVAGITVEELRARHSARIRTELAGGARGLPVDALIRDTAAMFGVSVGPLCSGARGKIYTLAKRKIIERCAQENVDVADIARALRCTPEAVYMTRKRHD